ncbi:MAG: ABC transporter ATP-binding protein [Beijerinckiaceae bacterium]|nr:ABC transporter ATP-binding protein [Beijerinckiaceae bacterium]
MSGIGEAVLRLEGVGKRFGALVANDAIDLSLHRGEVVALLGENGAGKTTLMNILFGHYVADEGRVMLADAAGAWSELPRGSPQAALAAGIGMVHQHFTLAENLTGLENIILGTQAWYSLRLSRREARKRIAALMRRTGLQADLDLPVDRLGVGERQRLEILKALYRKARILVLDEPTAVLTPQEAEGLFAAVRTLAREGLAVLFISHKLGEVLALTDRLVVLRSGRKVADRPTAGADRALIAQLMVGREVDVARPARAEPGRPVLVLDKVGAGQGRGRLSAIDLTIRAGEIVGIAGVSGNGQATLAELVAGLAQPIEGRMDLLGSGAPANPFEAIARGVGRLSEDRHRDGMVAEMSVAENLIMEQRWSKGVQRFGLIRRDAARDAAKVAIAAFDIRCPGAEAPLRLLSGGNIQKLLLARALAGAPRLILANQPTRGLDVGATVEVHARLRRAALEGAGVLLISEDFDELFALSHRIAVMHGGALTPAVAAQSLDVQTIGLAMAGQPGAVFEAAA